MPKRTDPNLTPTKARRIYLDLRSKILGRQLPAESQLTLRPLAAEYGTGINAASEAIKALAAEGLVTLAGKSGALVVARDWKRIRGEGVLRIAIECEAARRCAEAADDLQLSALEGLARKVDRSLEEQGDLDACQQADMAFHLAIVDFCGVPELRESVAPLLDRLVTPNHRGAGDSAPTHLAICKSLKSREPALAADLMRRHLEQDLSRTLAALD